MYTDDRVSAVNYTRLNTYTPPPLFRVEHTFTRFPHDTFFTPHFHFPKVTKLLQRAKPNKRAARAKIFNRYGARDTGLLVNHSTKLSIYFMYSETRDSHRYLIQLKQFRLQGGRGRKH